METYVMFLEAMFLCGILLAAAVTDGDRGSRVFAVTVTVVGMSILLVLQLVTG